MKTRQPLRFLLSLCLVFAMLLVPAAATGENETITISDAAGLADFRDAVNAGDTFEGKTVQLTDDINVSNVWAPIGNGARSGSSYTGNAFAGTFDGQGHSITNLNDALFGIVAGGTVKDVKLDGFIASESADSLAMAVNVLCGGSIEDVSVTGTVTAAKAAGGIVGRILADGTVSGCTNAATVSSTGSSDAAGGIVGKAYYTAEGKEITITGCTNSGVITGGYAAGGIAGFSAANVIDCSNTGAITGAVEAGGIVGEQTNYGEISGNTNSAVISNGNATGTAYGGIIGWVRYQISDANYPVNEVIAITGNTNTGDIDGEGSALGTGGIVGSIYNQATVIGNENTASSIKGGVFASGIVGAPQPTKDNLVIEGATVTVTGNMSSTTLENITLTGTCKDLYAYNNAPGTFVVENNYASYPITTGNAGFVTLADAAAAVEAGGTITLLNDIPLAEGVTLPAGITLDLNGKRIDGAVTAQGDLTFKGDGYVKTLKSTAGGTITVEDGKTLQLNNFSFGSKNNASAEYTITGGKITASYGFFQHGTYALHSDFETGYMYYSFNSDITVYGTFHSQGTGDGLDYVRGKLTIAEGGKSIHGKTLWVGQPESWGAMNASLTVEKGGYVQANSLSVYAGSELNVDATGMSAGAVSNVVCNTLTVGGSVNAINNSAVYTAVDGSQIVLKAAAAKIGETGFATLQAAIDAAAEGDTVTVLNDIQLTDTVTVPAGKVITLDLNGKTVSQEKACDGSYSMILNKGDLTIDDKVGGGKISFTDTVGGGGTTYGTYTVTNQNASLTIHGGTIEHLTANTNATPYPIQSYCGEGNTFLTITGGTISAPYSRSVRIWASSETYTHTVSITGGVFEGQVWLQNPSGGSKAVKADVTISGGDFAPRSNDGSSVFIDDYANANANITVAIEGGTFNTKIGGKTGESYSVTGGTFKVDPSAYLAEGYAAFQTETGYEVKELTETNAAAKIGDELFASLQAAIDAAAEGDTIVVLNDVTLTAGTTVPADKVITLDLNGKTVSYTSSVVGEDMITNNGTLTITDSAVGGKITYCNTAAAGSNVTASTISTCPGSVLTIDGGAVENTTAHTSGSTQYEYAIDILTNGGLGDVSATINGGTVTSQYMAIRQFVNGNTCRNSLTINGGIITGISRAVNVQVAASTALTEVNDMAILNITDGTITATSESGYSVCIYGMSNNISISGGTFTGWYWDYGPYYEKTAGALTGGTFNTEVSAADCAEGYAAFQTENGYEVKELTETNAAAKIGDELFATLQAAIDAAAEGDTVTVLNDITLTETVSIDTGITLDLNSKTVTGASGEIAFRINAATTIQNGTVIGSKSGTSSGVIDIYSNLTLENVTVETSKYIALRFKAADCRAVLTGCTVTGDLKGYGGSVWEIRSGTYNYSSTSTTDHLNGTAEVYGGTFHYAIDASDCAKDLMPKDNGDGTWTVTAMPKVAEADGQQYTTVAEALEKAEAGSTVTLLADCAGAGLNFWTKDVTLDLGGFTYTVTEGAGDLFTTGLHVRSGYTVTVKNGTVAIADDDNLQINYFIRSYGDLTLEDVTLDCANGDIWGSVNGVTTEVGFVAVGAFNDTLTITGKTSITNIPAVTADTAKAAGIEVWDWEQGGYAGVSASINTTGTIQGDILVGSDNAAEPVVSLTITGGKFEADPSAFVAEGYAAFQTENGYEVKELTETTAAAKIGDELFASLQAALDAAAAGSGNVTVEILKDIDLTNIDWNPVTVSAPGYPVVTVNGNDKTITGLNDMLFAGTWAGKSGLIINDLTIKDSTIVNDENDEKGTVGVGAFIGYPQASATITLNNCHLVNSTVKGGHWTGGLIGMAGGYNGNDGPVFMDLTITDCSVTGSTITGKGSAGAVMGHATCAAWTKVVIEDTIVTDNTISSTGSSTNKAGVVMGTIGAAGQETTANGVTKTGGVYVSVTENGNTATSADTAITTVYGRQGTSTGVLTITGGIYENYPIEQDVAYACITEGYTIVETEAGYEVKAISELLTTPEVTGALNADGKPELTWKTVEYAEEYSVEVYDADTYGFLLAARTESTSYVYDAAEAGRSYIFHVTAIRGEHSSYASAPVTVILPTVITAEPQSVSVNENVAVVFTVEATGNIASYQWQYLSKGADEWVNFNITDSNTLRIYAYSYRNGYQYRCVVTDVYGNVAESKAAMLTLRSALTIAAQPENTTVYETQSAAFSVEATGDNLAYQWFSMGNGHAWTEIDGETNAVLTVTNVTSDMNDMEFCCVVTDQYGQSITSDTAKLTVLEMPAPENVKATLSEDGSSIILTWDAVEGADWYNVKVNYYVQESETSGSEYQDEIDAEGTEFVLENVLNGVTYNFSVASVKRGYMGDRSDTVSCYVPNELIVTEQPADAETVVGESAVFSVIAAGDAPTYQWQYRTKNSDWMNYTLSTANSDTITVTAAAYRDGYSYRCVITDAQGKQVISDAATLTVLPIPVPVITGQPVNVTAVEGDSAVFTVIAEGDNLSYQWQYRTANGTEWNLYSSTAGSTLTVAAHSYRNGYSYRCVITNDYAQEVISDAATLTVLPAWPPVVFQQPEDTNAFIGESAVFSIYAEGTELTYQWQYRTKTSGWMDYTLSTANSDTITVTAAAYRDGYSYRCVVTDPYGQSAASEPAVLTVLPLPVPEIIEQPEDVAAVTGERAVFSVIAEGEELTYQWQYRTKTSGWINYPGDTNSDTFTVTAAAYRDGYSYRCVVTNSYGQSVTSDAAALTVLPAWPPVITGQPEDAAAAAGQTVTFSVAADGDELSYVWEYRTASGTEWSLFNSNAGDTVTVAVRAYRNGYSYRCVVTDQHGQSVASDAAVLTVIQ